MSKINYVDIAWNPVIGCEKISAGCQNCWAEKMAYRLSRIESTMDGYEDIIHNKKWNGSQMVSWQKLWNVKFPKEPKRIAVSFMGDMFKDKSISLIVIEELVKKIEEYPQHTFLLLTKRPENMNYYHLNTPNIWPGISVENQETANQRIPKLLKIPSARRWISVEPMLENIDISNWLKKIAWVVVGAESGPNRRRCFNDWILNIISQCQFYKIPVFVKQIHLQGKCNHNINEWPSCFRVQEVPK